MVQIIKKYEQGIFVEADAVTIKWFILSNTFVHQIDRTVKENCNYFGLNKEVGYWVLFAMFSSIIRRSTTQILLNHEIRCGKNF